MNVAFLIVDVLAHLPTLVAAGVDIAQTVSKIDAVIASEIVPGSPDWDMVKAKRAELTRQLNIDPPDNS